MFARFEKILPPTAPTGEQEPPPGLIAFYWYFVRQAKALFIALFAIGFVVALLDILIPVFIGRVVTLVSKSDPATVFAEHWMMLAGMAAVPVLLWFAGYIAMLRYFVPRMRDGSKVKSETRSLLTGRIVDTYTNIVTVKLFARARDEDAYVREAVDMHTGRFHTQLRLNTKFAMTLPMTMQIVSASGWVAWQITGIFENIGVVQEGMMTIAQPIALADDENAREIEISRGDIAFDYIRFGYGREAGLIEGLNLHVKAGEKIGLVGRSGAVKSTLVILLLRCFDLEGGRILIDGQDVAGVTQDSLRAQISVVTQDTSLLHRSLRDTIRCGR